MPPSQLKRLKASLRDQGITGPQKSKKQKKQGHGVNADQRASRQAALQGIRDSFNPFEVKAPSRPSKFETTSRQTINGKPKNGAVGRPGVTKSMGEEARRRTLLPEMQRRNKTGGILDRRIGESDPTMTPEERALQRFAREKQRKTAATLFDLEEADDDDAFTHMGKPLDFDNIAAAGNGLEMDDVSVSDDASFSDADDRPLKRRRPSVGSDDDEGEPASADGADDQPARKKTKAEVMKEVMAKSKLHKYERQKTKEEDDELRDELDKGMGDMLALLQGYKAPIPKIKEPATNGASGKGPQMNPDRLALLNGTSKEQADKEYDARLRALAMDKRAAPTDRTKTDEEKAYEEAERQKELTESRMRRMRGEQSEDDEEEEREEEEKPQRFDRPEDIVDDDQVQDDAADFGLSATQVDRKPLVLEDEDEFLFDGDLVASGSELSGSEESDDSDAESNDDAADGATAQEEDEEDEFVRGILDDKAKTGSNKTELGVHKSLAYSYACPQTHAELLSTFSDISTTEIPTVVQRIRALYHPSLSDDNKQKLGNFSVALVDHISYMATMQQPLPVIETLIRHVHSLSRTYPEMIATALRTHLEAFHKRGSPMAGDLVILTAIGSIYPTSDHFHQVVTPAVTLMARWLGMTQPSTSTLPTGAFFVSLCLHYQRLSKRYIPETVRFTLKALQLQPQPKPAQLDPHLANLLRMSDLWSNTSSLSAILPPSAQSTLVQLSRTSTPAKKVLHHLRLRLSQSRLALRPLTLHTHKPLAIKTSVPKFEENFNPDKHYDPDRERAESAKLRNEYKRERKGAVRELRKDASFVAREQLREKKERDVEYEKKYRRLVAEIQGTEGREGKEYEREKAMRKGRK